MPIKAENRARYPADWPEIRARIRQRSGNKCEWCGVANGALGGRLPDGRFIKALPVGEKMLRLEWPERGQESWCSDGVDRYLLRIIRIVLTVAHIIDHKPENCHDGNLAHLCQRCHNRHDAHMRQANAHTTRRAKKAIGELFTTGDSSDRDSD